MISLPSDVQFEQTFQAALSLHQSGRLKQAHDLYLELSRLRPDHAPLLVLLGATSHQLQRHADAIGLFDRAATVQPQNPAVYNGRGLALQALGELDRAAHDFDTALALKPGFADAYCNRGNVRQLQGDLDAAIADYTQAIALKPQLAGAIVNRGFAWRKQKQHARALSDFDQAIALKQDSATLRYERGRALQGLGQLDAAIADFDRAIALEPSLAQAWCSRGIARQNLLQLNAALADYERAIAIKPDYAEAHRFRASAILLSGEFSSGFVQLAHLAAFPEFARRYEAPLWHGEEPLHRKTILLHMHWGFGDAIHFARYATLVAERGAKVVLEVQDALVEVMKDLPGVAEVIAWGQAPPAFDYHCPLIRLPATFKTTLATIPTFPSYLKARTDKVARWSAKLGAKTRPRVGLRWSGNAGDGNDRNRSISLASLLPYLPPAFEYVSLQKDVRDDDADVLKDSSIAHFGDALGDFTDTAAVCALMDAIVSVDTSVAHLAAALGRPTWIMLPFAPDWRWQLDRADSPWYPSVTLYRQDQSRTWDSVFRQVADDLRKAR